MTERFVGGDRRPAGGGRGRQFAAMAVAASGGGIWCALLLRVAAEIAPMHLIWLRTALPAALALLIGGVAVPRSLARIGRPVLAWPLLLGAAYLVWPGVAPAWGVALLLVGVWGCVWLVRPELVAGLPGLWGDVVAFVGALSLYLSTLAPSVLPGDSGELQLAAATWGIPHPTGYPLYILLGRLFALFPVRSVAYRLNLFSAVAAAGAVWATYRLGRELGLRHVSSLVGAALLAVSETFWSQAVIAEKYALNAFFVAVNLWLGWRWRSAVVAGREHGCRLCAWAACYGLSLTHHRTMLLLFPAWVLLILLTDRRALRRGGWRVAASFFIPLSLYLLLPLFSALDPPYAYTRVDSVRSFFDLVMAGEYRGALFSGGWSALPGRLVDMGRLALRQFSPWGLLMVVGGWAILYRRQRAMALTILVGAAAELAFAVNYYVPNTFVYYLPAYVLVAVCGGVLVDGALTFLGGRRHLSLVVLLLAGVVPFYLGTWRWPGMDRRHSYARLPFNYDYGQASLRALSPGALLVGDWMPCTVLRYVQVIAGLAPTAQIEVVDPLEWGWERVVGDALTSGRAVYLARPVIAAGERYPLRAAGPLVRVLDVPEYQSPLTARFLSYRVVPGVRLIGYQLEVAGPGAEGVIRQVEEGTSCLSGSTLHLTLYWQAEDVPGSDYAVLVRLADSNDVVWLERQGRHPVGGTYPTSRWRPGEVVADHYTLHLPPLLPSGSYTLWAAMAMPMEEAGWVRVADLQVRKPLHSGQPLPGTMVRQPFGKRWVLMGCDAPREVRAGERVSVVLFWLLRTRVDSQPPALRLRVPGGEWVVTPLPVPADDLRPGSLIAARYEVLVPADLEQVEVRAGEPLWGERVRYVLPTRLVSTPPVANFGDRVLLRSYSYRTSSLHPGDTVYLTLEWETVKKVDERYKVFVHVLGHDGLPVAQQDNEPMDGTYPFTRWSVGERVRDRYEITLPGDLPPGEYQVEVGLYRISDMGRLPVLGQDRTAVDDKVFLSPLHVSR